MGARPIAGFAHASRRPRGKFCDLAAAPISLPLRKHDGMLFAGDVGMSDPSTVTRAPRLLDQVRAAIRLRHYSPKTEEAYRVTMLPDAVRRPLEDHLQTMKTQHDEDLALGCGGVALPGDLRSKYPNAPFEWPCTPTC